MVPLNSFIMLANLYALLWWYILHTVVDKLYCGGIFLRTVVGYYAWCGGLLYLLWWCFFAYCGGKALLSWVIILDLVGYYAWCGGVSQKTPPQYAKYTTTVVGIDLLACLLYCKKF